MREHEPSQSRPVPAWFFVLGVLTVAFGVLYLSTGEIVRGAVFAVAGTGSLAVNVVVAKRGPRPRQAAGVARFAGDGLTRYLMRWALGAGAAGAALCIPVLLSGSLRSGWLLFGLGLIAIHLALKVLALWLVARSMPSVIAQGEEISVMCSGRQPGIVGFFAAGTVLAATDRRLILASTSFVAERGCKIFTYPEIDNVEVGEGTQITLRGREITLSFTAVHPECAQALARAVEDRVHH